MKKRGQIESHILVYVLTVVIVAGIIVMGYKFISRSSKVMDRGELVQFQSKLAFDVKSISNDYGTFKKITYTLPRNLQEVCFVDLDKSDSILSSKLIDFYPIIKDGVRSNLSKNVFFIGKSDEQSFYIPNIAVNHYPFMNCFHQKSGKINIGIEGLGGGNSLLLTDFLTKAKINAGDKTILQSADEIVTIEASKGTQPSGIYLSIQMVQPNRAEFERGASDVYKLEPTRVKFTPPLELRIKYNPAIVGDCPEQLPFNQISEDGTKKTTLSESIDCKSKVAIFKIDEFI